MKKIIFAVLFSVSVICSFGQMINQVITNAGGSIVLDATDMPQHIMVYTLGAVTLSNDWELTASDLPPVNTQWDIVFDLTQINFNGHTVRFFGQTILPIQYISVGVYHFFTYDVSGSTQLGYYNAPYDFAAANAISGVIIQPATIPLTAFESDIPLTSMDTVGRGRILVGVASNALSSKYAAGNAKILIGDGTDLGSVAVSGDIGITNAGVTSISSGVIVNADVNSAAAIAFSKMASLTASKAVVTNSSGVITTSNQLSASLGGTAQDFSASTGFQTWSAGTASVGTITESENIWVSFESGYQCDNKIKMPCAGTITGLYAYAVKAVAGTDNGTIVPKNAAGTTMTSGTITFTASDPQGTAYTSTPSANNTFSAGDVLSFTTAKTTAGGVIELTITYTRSN